jgi:hypothetical protein
MATKSPQPKVKRLAIRPEDVCPICYDGLAGCNRATIAWCRLGFGGNFHRKCDRRQAGNPPEDVGPIIITALSIG